MGMRSGWIGWGFEGRRGVTGGGESGRSQKEGGSEHWPDGGTTGADGIAGHFARFAERAPIGNQAGKEWYGHLVTGRRGIAVGAHLPAIPVSGSSAHRFKDDSEAVFASGHALRCFFANGHSWHDLSLGPTTYSVKHAFLNLNGYFA